MFSWIRTQILSNGYWYSKRWIFTNIDFFPYSFFKSVYFYLGFKKVFLLFLGQIRKKEFQIQTRGLGLPVPVLEAEQDSGWAVPFPGIQRSLVVEKPADKRTWRVENFCCSLWNGHKKLTRTRSITWTRQEVKYLMFYIQYNLMHIRIWIWVSKLLWIPSNNHKFYYV